MFEYFETGGGTGGSLTHGGAITADDLPESRDRATRLAWMDEQQVEAALMFPTLAVGVEYQLVTDAPEAVGPNLTSFNRWLHDEWGFGDDGRIFGVPLLSLHDLDWAIAELERVLAAGARVVHLRAGPVLAQWSPADPRFDPFWARCEEVLVTHNLFGRFPELTVLSIENGCEWVGPPHRTRLTARIQACVATRRAATGTARRTAGRPASPPMRRR